MWVLGVLMGVSKRRSCCKLSTQIRMSGRLLLTTVIEMKREEECEMWFFSFCLRALRWRRRMVQILRKEKGMFCEWKNGSGQRTWMGIVNVDLIVVRRLLFLKKDRWASFWISFSSSISVPRAWVTLYSFRMPLFLSNDYGMCNKTLHVSLLLYDLLSSICMSVDPLVHERWGMSRSRKRMFVFERTCGKEKWNAREMQCFRTSNFEWTIQVGDDDAASAPWHEEERECWSLLSLDVCTEDTRDYRKTILKRISDTRK